MLFLDVKYANLLSPHLRNYKKKGDYLWNFSCPICGDSKKNKRKARGFIYKWKDTLRVKCHNCAYSEGLCRFLAHVDDSLYRAYMTDSFQEKAHKSDIPPPQPKKAKPEELVDSILDDAIRLDKLELTHPAVVYVFQRKLPLGCLKLLYYVPKFKRFVNGILPGKYKNLEDDHPRIIIPYFSHHGAVFAFQGRSLNGDEPKYITIKISPESTRIYGLDRVNPKKRVYAVEGPLDSLFIPNAIAVSGSTFVGPVTELLKSNMTVVFDNEPRNPEITKIMQKTIKLGFSVCIWPDDLKEKDINDMVIAGKDVDQIVAMIDANTFSGPSALLRLSQWRKTDAYRREDRKSMS